LKKAMIPPDNPARKAVENGPKNPAANVQGSAEKSNKTGLSGRRGVPGGGKALPAGNWSTVERLATGVISTKTAKKAHLLPDLGGAWRRKRQIRTIRITPNPIHITQPTREFGKFKYPSKTKRLE
jgi:hypothetical protein